MAYSFLKVFGPIYTNLQHNLFLKSEFYKKMIFKKNVISKIITQIFKRVPI